MLTKRRFLIAVVAMGAAFTALAVGGYVWLEHQNRQSGLAAARKWGRLAEFPPSVTNLEVRRAGSMFTREFVVTFNAPMAEMESWLARSPGTRGVAPEIEDGLERYRIKPGGRAQFAEVVVNRQSLAVRIRVYWS